LNKTVAKKSPARSFAKRAASAAAYIIFIALLLECAARVYLDVKDHIPFFASPARHIYRYYPGIEKLPSTSPARGELRVLLLGGSVLKNPLYDMAAPVARMVEAEPSLKGRKVRVFNLAVEGHTSLDSYYKYLLVARRAHFDYVVEYDGINDLRANNCPPEMFRNDYSHYSWYDEIDFYFSHEKLFHAYSYFPYFAYIATRRVKDKLSGRVYLPRERPRAEWYGYGTDIKTAKPFARNMNRIASLARKNGAVPVIFSFAYYIPPGYSIQKFMAGDYKDKYMFPVEMWGTPEAVEKGLEIQNGIATAIAEQQRASYVDEAARLRGRADAFIDVCHLSPAGVAQLSSDIARVVIIRKGQKSRK